MKMEWFGKTTMSKITILNFGEKEDSEKSLV